MIINTGLGIGIFISNFIALSVPLEEDGQLALYRDKNWRWVFGAPIFLQALSMLILTCGIKHMSLSNLIQDGDEAEAMPLIKKIYKVTDDQAKQIYHKIARSILDKDEEVVPLKEALTHSKYRRASWNGVILAFFQ